ncbi:MAG: MerR family transcriptional regulator [Alphaproteobacteria bacterium]|nr:MerR family transcriptional regulator [Alphaproteobacteria bacterium]
MVVNKSKSAFRTIAEVAEELEVATHVLRFWETKFEQIKPMKASGGRRYYRPDDVEIVRLIKNFLYEKRYTIEGVQKLFKDKGIKAILGGEIQKDFFDVSADESVNNVQIQEVKVCALSRTQKEILCDVKEELTKIVHSLKTV